MITRILPSTALVLVLALVLGSCGSLPQRILEERVDPFLETVTPPAGRVIDPAMKTAEPILDKVVLPVAVVGAGAPFLVFAGLGGHVGQVFQ